MIIYKASAVALMLSCTSLAYAEELVPSPSTQEPAQELMALSIAAAAEYAAVEQNSEPLSTETVEPVSVQDTANIQEVVSGSILETTENPEASAAAEENSGSVPLVDEASTTEEVVLPIESEVLGEATTTDGHDAPHEDSLNDVTIPGPASLQIVDADIVEEDSINPDIVDALPIVEPASIVAVAELPIRLEETRFVFELTGKQIPTRQQLLTSEGEVIDERVIDDVPVLSVDSETGGMTVSGVCGDAYYVILLYKEAEEYARDPRSYILNRAYECNGTYTYALNDLPDSLPSGQYYLLVGEQGSHGAWLPITSLVEITINRD